MCVCVCVEYVLCDAHARACERSMSARPLKHVIWRVFQAGPASSFAMDERTAKRYASVQHIKQKWYYRPGDIDEPNPFETCPTRRWRYKMRVWVLALKRAFDQDQEPQHEDAAPDLMAGSD